MASVTLSSSIWGFVLAEIDVISSSSSSDRGLSDRPLPLAVYKKNEVLYNVLNSHEK